MLIDNFQNSDENISAYQFNFKNVVITLCWGPKRPTSTELLTHPFFSFYASVEDEPSASPIEYSNDDLDPMNVDAYMYSLKSAVFNLIQQSSSN